MELFLCFPQEAPQKPYEDRIRIKQKSGKRVGEEHKSPAEDKIEI